MDPQLQALGVQFAETAVRNTAGAVADRITAAKARKKEQVTIAELEEIVYSLPGRQGGACTYCAGL